MKIFIIALTVVMMVTLSGCNLKEKASDMFWGAIAAQLEREMDEKAKKHEVIAGMDTVCVWHGHYEIAKTYDLNGERIDHLCVVVEDADDYILSGVTHYDSKRGCFYVIAEEGYAVIDKNDYCRVYLTLPEEEQDKVESKYIEYLDSYEDFSEKERKYFDKLKNK